MQCKLTILNPDILIPKNGVIFKRSHFLGSSGSGTPSPRATDNHHIAYEVTFPVAHY